MSTHNGANMMAQIFGGANPALAQAPAAAPAPGTPAQPASFTPSTNGDIDPSKQQATPDVNASPLDIFKDLFSMEKDKDGNDITPQVDDINAPLLDIDSDKLAEQVSKMSFLDGETFNDTATKALNGDVASLKSLIDGAVQQSYLRSAQLSGTVADRASRSAIERLNKALPAQLRDHSTKKELAGVNEVFSHPAMEPMVTAVSSQIQRKFPDMSAAQVAAKTNEYLKGISSSLAEKEVPEKATGSRRGEVKDADFADFFSGLKF